MLDGAVREAARRFGGAPALVAPDGAVTSYAELDRLSVSHVRALVVGGGPSPPDLVREARVRFGSAYSIRYSSTESGGLGTMRRSTQPTRKPCTRSGARDRAPRSRSATVTWAVVLDHAGVAEVSVVPRPDPVMGEVGVAVVVATDAALPPTLDELRAHAAPRLASCKLPEAVVTLDALPLTAMDKVDRRALLALVGGQATPA